jgi:hypothetical protein
MVAKWHARLLSFVSILLRNYKFKSYGNEQGEVASCYLARLARMLWKEDTAYTYGG